MVAKIPCLYYFFVECEQDVVQVQATDDYITMRVQAR